MKLFFAISLTLLSSCATQIHARSHSSPKKFKIHIKAEPRETRYSFDREFSRFLADFNHNYQKALFAAARYDYKEYVASLIDLGARINGYNSDGKTALMVAAQWGNKAVCKELLRQGASIDARTDWGSTALMWAAEHGRSDICKLLLDAGAYIDARTNNGITAYGYASKNGHWSVCKLLKNHGAYIKEYSHYTDYDDYHYTNENALQYLAAGCIYAGVGALVLDWALR
jgi:uncharacterized protein